MTQEKTNNVDPKIYEEVIGKIAQQRNDGILTDQRSIKTRKHEIESNNTG